MGSKSCMVGGNMSHKSFLKLSCKYVTNITSLFHLLTALQLGLQLVDFVARQ